MAHSIKFKLDNLSSSISNAFIRITDLQRNEIYSGNTLSADKNGIVELDLGELGSVDQGVIIYGDNYEAGNELTFKSFSGYSKILDSSIISPPTSAESLVSWSANTAEYDSVDGVTIKDYNGITDTPNIIQYDVEQAMGNIFDSESILLIKMSLPIKKMNTKHRYFVAGGPPTTSRCFHLSYFGGLNNNLSLRNTFEFNFRGSAGNRLTLKAYYKGGEDIIFCVRKKADNSVIMSIVDVATLEVTSVTDSNAENISIPNILNFTVGNCSTSLTANKNTTDNAAQEARFIGGLHSMFIYPETITDEQLINIAQGVAVTDYLGFSAQMARQFKSSLSNGEQVPLVIGCTDLVTSLPVYKVGNPTLPCNSITRHSKESWILNDPIIDGDVFAAAPNELNPKVLIKGTCSTNITSVKGRLISKTEVSDWVDLTVNNGVITGEINTQVKPDWFYIELSNTNETVKHRTSSRIGAGYVVFAPNQSQFRIMSTSDSDNNIATLNSNVKCSMVIDEDGSAYTGKFKNHVIEEGFPVADGIAGFFNELYSKSNAPILLLNNAVSGTGVDQWLDDSITERKWSDTVECVSHHRGSVISCVLWVWHTNNQTLGADYPVLFDAVINNQGAYKSVDNHYLGNLFADGYKFVVMPATRATEGKNDSYDFNNGSSVVYIDAVRKAQRLYCENNPHAIAGPETIDMAIYDNGWDGPHENRDIPQGTWRLGYRCAIGVSRGLGLDSSKDGYISSVSLNAERTIATVSLSLPNPDSKLKTDGFDTDVSGFEFSEDGSIWTRSGFTAQISGQTVLITKDVDAWPLNTLVRYCYGGPLSYGAIAEQTEVYKKVLYDGASYEGGLGLPIQPLSQIEI